MVKKNTTELACIVDNTGHLRAQFVTEGAKTEAELYLKDCKAGGVEHLQDATVVTGSDAKKALENGRI